MFHFQLYLRQCEIFLKWAILVRSITIGREHLVIFQALCIVFPHSDAAILPDKSI